jgi:hypothetical protein
MKRTLAIALLILPISFVECSAKEQIRSYCLEYNLQGDTGRGKIELGTFVARLDLKRTRDKISFSFSDTMPDSHQEIFLKSRSAAADDDSHYTIQFEDNWGNQGEGSVQTGARLAKIHFGRIIPAKDSWSRNAIRGYGNFTLSRAACVNDPLFRGRQPPG